MGLKRWLGEKLMRVYGSSLEEEEERTQRTADAVRQRAEQRSAELDERSEVYSRTIADAYTRREREG